MEWLVSKVNFDAREHYGIKPYDTIEPLLDADDLEKAQKAREALKRHREALNEREKDK